MKKRDGKKEKKITRKRKEEIKGSMKKRKKIEETGRNKIIRK